MRLADLSPRWFSAGPQPKDGHVYHGVTFDCPTHRTHRLAVSFKPPISTEPGAHAIVRNDAPLWDRTGESFETLTLSPSVFITDAGCWHGFVRNGEITNA